MYITQKWVLKRPFEGVPKEEDFELVEETLPDLQEGEILCEAVYLSVEPHVRTSQSEIAGMSRPLSVIQMVEGDVIMGEQIAKVIESRNSSYPIGLVIVGKFGWQSHTIARGQDFRCLSEEILNEFPLSVHLGVLGHSGVTAYFGLLDMGKPKPGQVVVVNSAAGAVGSTVGQIAKIKGCTVIGYAGTEEKCALLRKDGFDYAFNYKDIDLNDSLKKAAPDGVDIFFDNVGGDFTCTVFRHMKEGGRVVICGQISSYNRTLENLQTGPLLMPFVLFKQLIVRGFATSRWESRYQDAYEKLAHWMRQGKLKYRETVREGFESLPKTFIGLFSGESTGKTLVNIV